ncbi:MAG: multifunctional CCA addition/repair protein [Gammaproteobacteria bacterium]
MKTYLVGGAVRDKLLDYPVKEKDWVVIGETPEAMIARGFRPVGKDFPVFLHPKTHEEYALARTERKTAPGYKGFRFHAAPDITLEQDLLRRDLTINAMAMDGDGNLIDPYGGRHDLENRILRHVSPAFGEDPVRILRVARLAARYAHLGFRVADDTLELMRGMVGNGEADHLVAERVWAELVSALAEKTPSEFIRSLRNCGALAIVMPEIDRLFGVPQPEKYHPEIDTGVHILLVVDQAAKLSGDPLVVFAALVHDLGKGVTPAFILPSHRQHETKGLPLLEELCRRLRVPNEFRKLAMQVMRYHTHCHRVFELRPSTLTDMLAELGAFKPQNKLDRFLLACEADIRGRTGLENEPYPQAGFIRGASKAGGSVDASKILGAEMQGPQIGEAIRSARIAAIAEFRKNYARSE